MPAHYTGNKGGIVNKDYGQQNSIEMQFGVLKARSEYIPPEVQYRQMVDKQEADFYIGQDDLLLSAAEYAARVAQSRQNQAAAAQISQTTQDRQAASKAIVGLKALAVSIQRDNDPDKDYDDPQIDRLFNQQGLWIGLYPQEHRAYKLERFICEFLRDYDATRAALASGYCFDVESEDVVRAKGSMLRRTLRKQIRLRADNIANKCGITAEKIMREMGALAFSNIGDYLSPGGYGAVKDLSSLPKEALSCIKEITVDQIMGGRGDDKAYVGDKVKIKLHDKLEALKLLGGHIKAIDIKPDRQEDRGDINITFVNEGDIQARRVKRVDAIESVSIAGGIGLLAGIVEGGGRAAAGQEAGEGSQDEEGV
jgi:phage terminase small subunit